LKFDFKPCKAAVAWDCDRGITKRAYTTPRGTPKNTGRDHRYCQPAITAGEAPKCWWSYRTVS